MGASHCGQHCRYTRGCDPCRERAAAYRRRRLEGLRTGDWTPGYVVGEEMERVLRHVRELVAVRGISCERIALVAGCSRKTVEEFAAGHTGRITTPVAEALLGTTAQACLRHVTRPTTPVDIIGSQRRLQALARDGWGSAEIGGLLGMNPSLVRRHRGGSGYRRIMITWRVHQGYRELFEKIQSQADPSGPSEWTRRHAERLGYLPAERWADEDIDNPHAEPLPPLPDTDDHVAVTRMVEDAVRQPFPGKAKDYPPGVRREIARHAYSRLGWPMHRIAELLGRTPSTVEYLLHGRKDRPEPKRRS